MFLRMTLVVLVLRVQRGLTWSDALLPKSPRDCCTEEEHFVQEVIQSYFTQFGLLIVCTEGRSNSSNDFFGGRLFRNLNAAGRYSLLVLTHLNGTHNRVSRDGDDDGELWDLDRQWGAVGYVLIASTWDAFRSQVGLLAGRGRDWNPSARFVLALRGDVIVSSPPPPPPVIPEGASTLFALLRSLFALNVVLGVPRGTGTGTAIDVFASFPYRDATGVCGLADLGLRLLDTWYPEQRRFQHGEDLFPRKMMRLEGCTVRAVSTRGPLQARLLEEISERLNVTMVSYGGGFSTIGDVRPVNGKWGGQIVDLQIGRADMALLLLPTVERARYFRPTQPFVAVRVDILLRCRQTQVGAQYPLLNGVWLPLSFAAILAGYLGIAIAASRLEELAGSYKRRSQGYNLGRGLYEFWSVLMEMPVKEIFMPPRFRLVHLLVVFGLLIINGLVKSSITAELSISQNPDRVTRLSQIGQRGIELGFPAPVVLDNLQTALRENHDAEVGSLLRRSHSCAFNFSDCLSRLRNDTRTSYGLAVSRLGTYSRQLAALRVCAYPVREPVEVAPVSILTRRGDPLGPLLDTLISRQHAAGLPYLWLDQLAPQVYSISDAGTGSAQPANSETWRQLVVALKCCAGGLIAAMLVFIGERFSLCAAVAGSRPETLNGKTGGRAIGTVIPWRRRGKTRRQ